MPTKENIIKVLKYTIQNNGTLVDVARNLGITIVEASDIVDKYRIASKKIDDILTEKKWPQKIKEGYIYIGGYELTVPDGVRSGLLHIGMNVLAQKLPRRGKYQKYDFYMLYLPYRRIVRKYKKAKLNFTNDKISGATYIRDEKNKIKEEWLLDDEDYSELKRELRATNIILQPTDSIKEVMYEGKELGVTASNTIVNVNHDWT